MLTMNAWLPAASRVLGRIKVVGDVETGSAVCLGQRRKVVDVLHGAEAGPVEGCVAAGLVNLDMRNRAIALDLEGDVEAMADGLRIEHIGVPLRGYLLVDLLDGGSEFSAEGGVGDVDASGAGAGLDAAHGNPDAGAFAGLHLVGLDLDGLRMERRRRRGLVRELRGLGGLDRDGDRVGLGYVDGFRRWRDGRGRWVIRGEDIVLI